MASGKIAVGLGPESRGRIRDPSPICLSLLDSLWPQPQISAAPSCRNAVRDCSLGEEWRNEIPNEQTDVNKQR
jgi:hypothetical protein